MKRRPTASIRINGLACSTTHSRGSNSREWATDTGGEQSIKRNLSEGLVSKAKLRDLVRKIGRRRDLFVVCDISATSRFGRRREHGESGWSRWDAAAAGRTDLRRRILLARHDERGRLFRLEYGRADSHTAPCLIRSTSRRPRWNGCCTRRSWPVRPWPGLPDGGKRPPVVCFCFLPSRRRIAAAVTTRWPQ